MSTRYGWDQLHCEYFYQTCEETCGPYFRAQGFDSRETPIGGALYFRLNVFVEISYIPETFPIVPTVIVGFDSEKFSKAGDINYVPLWYLLSKLGDATQYSQWRFQDKRELARVLAKLLSELIDVHVRPLWSDPDRLAARVLEFRNSIAVKSDHPTS